MNLFPHDLPSRTLPPLHEVQGVLLYEERHLSTRSPDHDGAAVLEMTGRLLRAGSAAARESLVRAELEALGVDSLEYGKVHWRNGVLEPVSFLTSYADADWLQRYCELRYWEVDGRLQAGAATGAPQWWSVAGELERERAAPLPRPHAIRMLQQLAQAGVASGLTVVLSAPALSQGAVLHFLSRRDDAAWADRQTLAGALLLAVSLHEFIVSHTAPAAAAEMAAGLSALQSRIADCVARGLSDKEVARSLALSRHTVDYHLRVLRSRFKARNRVQLAQAISLGS
jgi:DNA-binding CsgD family transcriptional regulator